MAAVNPSASIEVTESAFIGCASNTSGGAIAAMGGAQLIAANATFQNNTAAGLGGGAIFAEQVCGPLCFMELVCLGRYFLCDKRSSQPSCTLFPVHRICYA